MRWTKDRDILNKALEDLADVTFQVLFQVVVLSAHENNVILPNRISVMTSRRKCQSLVRIRVQRTTRRLFRRSITSSVTTDSLTGTFFSKDSFNVSIPPSPPLLTIPFRRTGQTLVADVKTSITALGGTVLKLTTDAASEVCTAFLKALSNFLALLSITLGCDKSVDQNDATRIHPVCDPHKCVYTASG